jgi:hypothetical protein
MKRLFALVTASALTAAGFAEEPPKPVEKKVEPKKEAETPPEEDVDVQKTSERIAENAQKAGDRLKEKDPGTETRKIQDEILKDIDALLKKAQQPPPQSPDVNPMMPPPDGMPPPPMGGMPPPKGGSGMPPPKGGQSQSMPMGGMGSGGGTGQNKPQPGGRREQRQRKDRGGDSPMGGMPPMAKQEPGGQEPMPAKLDPKDGPAGGNKPMGDTNPDKFGKASPKRQNDKMADLYKDVWGHLPDRMRQEMDLYYREQFMPRYSDLLRRYYSALAEQRKKGDDR